MRFDRLFIVTAILAFATPAMAHTDSGILTGFAGGFMHPLLGLDHLVAMVAVGLWGAFLGGSAVWLLPIVFPLVMALGGAVGIMGISLPAVELLVAASAIVLGLCVALAWRAPLPVAMVLVGVFAIFHGHAHGTELPQASNPLAYSAGFVIATGALHLCGIAIGLLTQSPTGRLFVRSCGAAIAATGVAFFISHT